MFCRIQSLNAYVVFVFALGVVELHDDLISEHVDPFLPLRHPSQHITTVQRLEAIAALLHVCMTVHL
jgi:hypothetical protein